MEIDSIRLFVVAADLLNISAAGKTLGMPPSVASARLAKLEKYLGADLFHRSTRKVALSIEGTEFLPFAKEIIAQTDAALAVLGRRDSKVTGTLRFAASSTFAQLHIAPILPEFLDRYPDVNIELKLSDTQVNLIEGGFDLALRNCAVEDSSFIGRRLTDDTRILCASPAYLKKRGTPMTPEELDQHQILVFMHSKPRKLTSPDKDAVYSFPPPKGQFRVVCDDGASMRIAAKAGVGICISSIWSVHSDLQAGSLVRVLPNYQIDDKAAIWLIYPKTNVLTMKVRVFIDYLVEKIGDPPSWEL